jgi:hypothetical protein
MNRGTFGALCVAACLLSLIEARRTRQSLGAMALEKIERVFDVVEHVFHPA